VHKKSPRSAGRLRSGFLRPGRMTKLARGFALDLAPLLPFAEYKACLVVRLIKRLFRRELAAGSLGEHSRNQPSAVDLIDRRICMARMTKIGRPGRSVR
jgi:hypothetical protein